MRYLGVRGLRWCASITGILLLGTACGGSNTPELDESLVTQVRSGFSQIERADGSTIRLALHLDVGSRTKDLCMLVRTEAKSASPSGERAEIGYYGSAPDIGSDGSCSSDAGPRKAIVDGSTVYVPSSSARATDGCDAVYDRSKISKNAAAELNNYANKTATSKVSELINVTKKISEDGSDVVLDLDAEKTSEKLGNGADLPDDASASMTVTFAADHTSIKQINVMVTAGEVELREYVLYQAVGEVQHVELPKAACVEARSRTVTSVSEILNAIGMSS